MCVVSKLLIFYPSYRNSLRSDPDFILQGYLPVPYQGPGLAEEPLLNCLLGILQTAPGPSPQDAESSAMSWGRFSSPPLRATVETERHPHCPLLGRGPSLNYPGLRAEVMEYPRFILGLPLPCPRN